MDEGLYTVHICYVAQWDQCDGSSRRDEGLIHELNQE